MSEPWLAIAFHTSVSTVEWISSGSAVHIVSVYSNKNVCEYTAEDTVYNGIAIVEFTWFAYITA